MQQRQLRLGDILDDYCPRERRVTNHVIVAMVGSDVKQTRCTTCDADHEYKHAKVPRQRRKSEVPAVLSSHGNAPTPKRIAHEAPIALDARDPDESDETFDRPEPPVAGAPLQKPRAPQTLNEIVSDKMRDNERDLSDPSDADSDNLPNQDEHDDDIDVEAAEEGPVHRPLIRATLPRIEGQPPPTRPAPDFTIRQPAGRPGRFRPRHQRGGQPFGNGSSGNVQGRPGGGGPPRGGMPRHGSGGRPPQGGMASRMGRRDGPGRKRQK